MLGLIQAKLSGDCAPFLRMITALYSGEKTPAMSRSLDLLLVMSGMRDSLADGNPQSVAKRGRSKEVTALLARLDQLTRWERPIISPLKSNPPTTLESPDGVEDSLTADDTKGEDSPKTSKKRRRRKKKSTKGEEKQAALQYQWS